MNRRQALEFRETKRARFGAIVAFRFIEQVASRVQGRRIVGAAHHQGGAAHQAVGVVGIHAQAREDRLLGEIVALIEAERLGEQIAIASRGIDLDLRLSSSQLIGVAILQVKRLLKLLGSHLIFRLDREHLASVLLDGRIVLDR